MNVFRDKDFAEFRMILDSEMKRLKRAGIHSRGHKVEPVTPKEEESSGAKGFKEITCFKLC